MDERKSNPWCTHNRAHRWWSHGVAEYIRTTVNRRPIYKFPFNLDLHTRSTFVRLHHKESWRRTEKIANKFSHAPLPRVTWPVAVVINSVVVLALFTNRRSIREENESVAVIRATERRERIRFVLLNTHRSKYDARFNVRRLTELLNVEICRDRFERWVWVDFCTNLEVAMYPTSWDLLFFFLWDGYWKMLLKY